MPGDAGQPGTADQAWVNAYNDTTVFVGTTGTVTLTDAETVGGLQFNNGLHDQWRDQHQDPYLRCVGDVCPTEGRPQCN